MDREAFQEIDYCRMFGQMAKWVAQIDDPRRVVPEYMSHAFHTATSGRPGPVVLVLPEDMLSKACDAVPATPRYQRVAAIAFRRAMEKLRDLLANAKKPFMAAAGRLPPHRISRASPSVGSCRWAARSAIRTR